LPHFLGPADCSDAGIPATIAAMLGAEFERRQRSNARYSLRAFALALGLDSSTLSQIVRGRRRVSAQNAARLAARAGFDALDRVDVANEALRQKHEGRIIRQVARCATIGSSRVLARRLRLRVDDANAALTRLMRDRRLTMIAPSRWLIAENEES
jgi:transcriptional regulator with XRE-family HTH domain